MSVISRSLLPLIALMWLIPFADAQAPTHYHIVQFDRNLYQPGDHGVANVTIFSNEAAELYAIQVFLIFRQVDGLIYTTSTGQVYEQTPLQVLANTSLSELYEFEVPGIGYSLVSGPVMYEVFISIRKIGEAFYLRETSLPARAFTLLSSGHPSYESIISENAVFQNQIATLNGSLNNTTNLIVVMTVTAAGLLVLNIYQALFRTRRNKHSVQ